MCEAPGAGKCAAERVQTVPLRDKERALPASLDTLMNVSIHMTATYARKMALSRLARRTQAVFFFCFNNLTCQLATRYSRRMDRQKMSARSPARVSVGKDIEWKHVECVDFCVDQPAQVIRFRTDRDWRICLLSSCDHTPETVTRTRDTNHRGVLRQMPRHRTDLVGRAAA